MPIILPLFNRGFQPSLSEFHYTSQKWTYILGMGSIGFFMLLDGLLYKSRRYNILIGLSMIGVIIFPVNEFRWIHNSFAGTFFVGNAIIVTYYSPLLQRHTKILFSIIISITLLMLFLGEFNIYVTESIGMFSMSYFMSIRYYILELRRKHLCN
jgi:hypothetical protein